MKEKTFKRGIHPPGSKFTAGNAIKTILPKKGNRMIYPMIQNIGAPCEPIVNIGDKVFLGQKIADSSAFVSAPIHASTSGVVKALIKTLTPTGITSPALVIECDGEEYSELEKNVDYNSFSREEIIKIVREAGIVGLGGAGFPTHIKLNPPPDKKIDFIIINASECEPYLTSDHRSLLEETEDFINGVQIVLKLFPEAYGMVGVETNKSDAIEKLIQATKNIPNLEIVPLTPKYPQGSEKHLIYACTNREVPSGGLPADAGCIVYNVDTVASIYRAVAYNYPLIDRIVTMSGGAVNKPGNYRVHLGMVYHDFLKAAGGFKTDPAKMVCGGPMMGVAMFDLSIPFTKTSSAFLCFTEEESHLPLEKNCIRCARCVNHCPMYLIPLELNQYAVSGNRDMFLKNNGMDCVECGSCSYVCPSKRHIAQSIRATRRTILAERKNK